MWSFDRTAVRYTIGCINFFEYLTDVLNRADVLQQSATLETYRDILTDHGKRTSKANDLAFPMLLRQPGDAYHKSYRFVVNFFQDGTRPWNIRYYYIMSYTFQGAQICAP